ncbi:hypothetical protein [Streptomyces sp. NPDC005752]|uniref:hypothetical protein n=1 Tax=Streptomyces sp. NPDC005752 TaxID=3157065 RepID=UPI0033DBAF81
MDRPGGGTAEAAEDDRGCLRLVLGVPLVILHLLAGYCCYGALMIRPSGPWDEDALMGIELACLLTIVLSAAALLITTASSVRRVMAPWWFVPPAFMALVAVVRRVLLD